MVAGQVASGMQMLLLPLRAASRGSAGSPTGAWPRYCHLPHGVVLVAVPSRSADLLKPQIVDQACRQDATARREGQGGGSACKKMPSSLHEACKAWPFIHHTNYIWHYLRGTRACTYLHHPLPLMRTVA